jgi:hypothetical protein
VQSVEAGAAQPRAHLLEFIEQIGHEGRQFGHGIEIALEAKDLPRAPKVAAAEAPG